MASSRMCDDVPPLAGAKRKSDDNSSSADGGTDAPPAQRDLPPAKRMATAAGPGTQQSSSAPGAVTASLAPPSGLSRFGFKASTPLKKPPAAALATEPIVRGRGQLTGTEKALTRPPVTRRGSNQQLQTATATAEPEAHVPAPRSSGRLTLKQKAAPGASLLSKRPALAIASALPAPTLRLTKRSPRTAPSDSAASDLPTVPPLHTTRVRDAFVSAFAATSTEALDELLKFRSKASKFNAKARQDEHVAYIRQLKAAVRSASDAIRTFDADATALDDKIQSERAALERRLAVLEQSLQSKTQATSQVHDELARAASDNDALRRENAALQHETARLVASDERSSKALLQLEARVAELQTELQLAQKQNDQLTLELKAHQATLTDRVQLYEEKKKELQQFYEHKDSEEEKRKSSEIERLQSTLTAVREELAAANKETAHLKDRARDCENELKQERARRSHLELEKCTLEAQHQSLELRCGATQSETSELKSKLQQKEDEIMKMLTTMTEIQKFTASANTKLEAEKRELADKIDALQRTVRDLERADVEHASAMRELKSQLEANAGSKERAEQQARDAQTRMRALEAEAQESARQLSVKVGVCEMLESQARELRNEHVAVNAQMEAIRSEMRRLQESAAETKKDSSARAAELEAAFARERAGFQRELEQLQEARVSLESEVQTLRERVSSARDGDLEELCTVKREAEVLRLRLKELSHQGTQTVAQKDRLIEELQEKVKAGDKLRRAMHNTIQELRGNVRVFARTRPFLPSDRSGCGTSPDTLVPAISCEYDGQTMKLKRPGKSGASEPETYSFSFDKVFAPSMGQDAVFEEVAEFVQSSLDGYHVCLFSYGQTGSGKTHTMQGSGNGQMRGIIPRSIEKVLSECARLELEGWRYSVQVSFLEIYNEALKDLLATREQQADAKLAIKKDSKGGVYVPDLTLVDVRAMEQVEALMERASRARSVACTDMNAQSSRSHSVFTLHLQGVNDAEGVSLDGKLNLVDLAGSERASRSNVSGDRLKETQAINKSLSCLADVFTAIGNKSSHIPFRNSKLTYLLQSSLSGDGKTLMMVNLSPTLESASESLCSLRFAKQVNQCELGKPRRQIKSKRDPQAS